MLDIISRQLTNEDDYVWFSKFIHRAKSAHC